MNKIITLYYKWNEATYLMHDKWLATRIFLKFADACDNEGMPINEAIEYMFLTPAEIKSKYGKNI